MKISSHETEGKVLKKGEVPWEIMRHGDGISIGDWGGQIGFHVP